MNDYSEAPNLLDAMLEADAEGITELINEIALRIGAKPHEFRLVLSTRKQGGKRSRPLIGIYNDVGPSHHASSMTEVIGRYSPEGGDS